MLGLRGINLHKYLRQTGLTVCSVHAGYYFCRNPECRGCQHVFCILPLVWSFRGLCYFSSVSHLGICLTFRDWICRWQCSYCPSPLKLQLLWGFISKSRECINWDIGHWLNSLSWWLPPRNPFYIFVSSCNHNYMIAPSKNVCRDSKIVNRLLLSFPKVCV